MTSPPLVSIVTPSFNQGRFLRRTVDSVLAQGYPHVEYVVIDGGSTDDSVEVLRSYGRRFAWLSEPDRGQTHAINKGFALCRGEILAYLNSDDVLLPGAVERVVEHFLSNPGWDLVYGRAHYIDEADRVIGSYRTAPYSFGRLVEDNCLCQPAVFWRRELAERLGPLNERLHYCMDYEYWLRAAQAGAEIVHVEDLLACSRLYPETKTIAGREQMLRESLEVCRAWVGYVPPGPFLGLWQEGEGRWRTRLPWLARYLSRLQCCWSNWRLSARLSGRQKPHRPMTHPRV